ncbi:MAG: VWA domain-containing protein [Nanoarchaeota archaeon]
MIGFTQPQYFMYIIPAVILLAIIIKLDFLRAKDDDFRRKDRRKTKALIFISRTLLILLLFTALAQPFLELEIEDRGPPKLTLLIDSSRSMDVFSIDTDKLKSDLEKKIPVKAAYIGRNTTSNLGDGILANLEPEANILLVTDGYSNAGLSLADVASRAVSVNASISALEIIPDKNDASVLILGDERSFSDVDYAFEVRILSTKEAGVPIKVSVDDRIIYNQKTTDAKLEFKERLDPGVHTITASVEEADHFSKNNIYYKTVKVIEKPKLLFITKNTGDPLKELLEKLYSVDTASEIPGDLKPYYTIIINDRPAGELNQESALLTNYLIDGNGLIVVGGFNSFDRGSYKKSLFETLLPVRVGSAERKRGNSNIILVVDISGASDILYEGKRISPLDVNKGLALEVIKTLNLANRVGVIAFNDKPYKVADLSPLYENKAAIEDKISRLKGGGQSSFDVGLKGAYELLKTTKGDRAIILLTDGLAYVDVQDRATAVASSLRSLGITTYVVGVGRTVQDVFLEDLANNGGGIYFPASEANKLTILFGEPEDIEQGSDFGLFILNPTHFITRGLTLTAVMNGYNEVVPKTAGRSLITTAAGGPAVTVWNYGVGRVGTITVFSGGNLGQLLTEQNSLVISRTINWAIGDPERKQDYLVSISDGYVDVPFVVRVKSDKRPTAEGYEFYKTDTDMYESEKFTVPKTGFSQILATTFAVNNEKEYAFIGYNDNLAKITSSTGGKLFKPQDIDEIVDFMRKSSRKTHLKKVSFTWLFVILAIIIFLIEIGIRKTQQHLKEKQPED